MEQVFVINPKGGCGKTTISTQMAAYYASVGRDVMIADHDAQKSSSDWLASRPEQCATIQCVALKPETIFDAGKVDIVIHDMPAAWDLKHLNKIIMPGDRMLIPVLASPTDIRACLRFIMSMYREGLLESEIKVGLVPNRAKGATRYFKILMSFLEKLQIPVVGQLRDTQNYVRLMDRGMTVFDVPPSRVKKDLEQWQPIIQWLGINN